MLVSQRAFGPDSSLPGAPFKEGSSNAPMDSKRSSNGGGGGTTAGAARHVYCPFHRTQAKGTLPLVPNGASCRRSRASPAK